MKIKQLVERVTYGLTPGILVIYSSFIPYGFSLESLIRGTSQQTFLWLFGGLVLVALGNLICSLEK